MTPSQGRKNASLDGLLPDVAVLELTYRCNHSCTFCSCPWFAPDSNFKELPELSIKQWKRIITRIVEAGVDRIAFTGGEPLLKEGYRELVAHAAGTRVRDQNNRAPALYLLSNGRLMSSSVLQMCKEYGVALSMSLPGLNTFHEHTRAGRAKDILKWFGEAHNLGVRTTAGITVTKQNLGELYETIGEALLAGADQILLNRFLPGGRGLMFERKLALGRQEIQEMLDTAEEVLRMAGRYGHVGTELPACVVGETSRFKQLQVGSRCAAAVDFFVIDPSGYVRVCNHSPIRLTHVSRLERLANNPYWKRFVTRTYLPKACQNCNLSSSCDAGCRESAHITCGSPSARERGLEYQLQTSST